MPLPCTLCLARKDVSLSCPRGAKRLCWCKGVSTLQLVLLLSCVPTVHCCVVCGVYLVRSTPFVRMLSTVSCPLASSCLTWAALSQPQSCFGCSTRDDVSSLWLRGATAPCFSFLDCPIYLGQLEPTTLPLWRLAPVSCSVGLSPTLSLPISLALSCSISPVAPLCSFPTVLYPLSLSFSLSLSLSLSSQKKKRKGGSGHLVHLYPPRGSNHPPRDRRGVVYPLSHDDGVSAPCAPIFFSCVSPPVMHIFFRVGVCSAACRGTAQRPRIPGPPA